MNRDDVDLVVSIHQNSFSGESSKGAQVFYQTGSVDGEAFAKVLQAQLASCLDTENHRRGQRKCRLLSVKEYEADGSNC